MTSVKKIPDEIRKKVNDRLDLYMKGAITLKAIAKELEVPYSWVVEVQRQYMKKILSR